MATVQVAPPHVTQPEPPAEVEGAKPVGEVLTVGATRRYPPPAAHSVRPEPVGGKRTERDVRVHEWVEHGLRLRPPVHLLLLGVGLGLGGEEHSFTFTRERVAVIEIPEASAANRAGAGLTGHACGPPFTSRTRISASPRR